MLDAKRKFNVQLLKRFAIILVMTPIVRDLKGRPMPCNARHNLQTENELPSFRRKDTYNLQTENELPSFRRKDTYKVPADFAAERGLPFND
ncbi:MAG: hypothetical protein QT03_C0001G1186 [archaeon GW2011_AR10]|nr:MAG: hypothetical protein QT03_C0001G1186 [archaeon GW2011_AR10]